MLQAYVIENMFDTAVFDLFARRLPRQRNYLIACGLDDALAYLETLHFDDAALAYLASIGKFKTEFLDYLASFHFSGDVYAVAEGTAIFPGRKQVYRLEKDGYAVGDVMALHGESQAGKPLIQAVMRDGRKLTDTPTDLVAVRDHCRREIAALPKHILQLRPAEQPYPVSLSSALEMERRRLSGKLKPGASSKTAGIMW